jgi:4-amino-4-deoxy-L-arabinose transferase-like glycosyltransferase
MLSTRHWCWALLPLIAIAASFWHLGAGSLHDWDEAIYAQVSKEMNESGDWLRPHYGYKPWIDKPPLLMWSTAFLFHLFGVSEFSARAASAFAGVVVIVLTYAIAATMFDRWTGIISITILLTTFQFVKYERRGMTDVPLTMFVLIAVYAYTRLAKGDPRWWLLIFSAAAFSFMLKSLASLIIPAAVLVMIVNQSSDVRRVLRSKYFFFGLILALIIAAPWHVFMFAEYGSAFWTRYFGFHLAHAHSALQGNVGDAGFYLRVLSDGMFPWIYLLPFALSLELQKNLAGERRSLILITLALLALGLYQIAQTKLPYYIMPVYPVLAILTGHLISIGAKGSNGFSLSSLLTGSFISGMTVRPLLALLVFCGFALVAFLLIRKKINPRSVAICAFAVLLILGLHRVAPLYREGVSPVAVLGRAAVPESGPDREPMIVFSGLYEPTALFYSGRPILEAHNWDDVKQFAGNAPTRIIMAKQDLISAPAGYSITVEKEADGLIYGRISRRDGS